MSKLPHFNAPGLIEACYQQPIGLCVNTNHPAGFRRLMYLAMRKPGVRKVRILQSPKSGTAFYLVRDDYKEDSE